MRLLETSTLELSEFVEGSVPKYAILSHTWGDGEVLFRDLEKDPSAKAGWNKIQSACRVARERGYSWIWIDTCCIDKASSSELSEAINSMFRWYRKADLCLAYLSDVAYFEPETDECRTALAGSRWFTRGWTLQELLAPSSLDFYAQDWRLLGTRSSFRDVIEQRTGIRRRFLYGGWYMEDASIAERMSWASQRTTTRAEDTAYCLLGIFDTNMPLIYGEGDKAFKRLQQAIIQNNDDQSIFAWGNIAEKLTFDSRLFMDGLPLLAASPIEFKDCGDIIPLRNDVPTPPVRVDTTGITLVTPLLAETSKWYKIGPSDFFLAPLLCRRRSDFFNTIALPLRSIQSRSTNRPAPALLYFDGASYFRATRVLLTVPATTWASERLCSVFIQFRSSNRVFSRLNRDHESGCAVRTLPKGHSLGVPYVWNWLHCGEIEKSANIQRTSRIPASYGLAFPIVIPLRGPPASENDGRRELALVLQYQYMSADTGNSSTPSFESNPSWMVNRVVTIPQGSTVAAVAQTVKDESETWPAEYVRLISGAGRRLESGQEREAPPDLFDRSSLRTFTRFHVGVTTDLALGKVLIVDVVDLMGENDSLEVNHYGNYIPVKGSKWSFHGVS